MKNITILLLIAFTFNVAVAQEKKSRMLHTIPLGAKGKRYPANVDTPWHKAKKYLLFRPAAGSGTSTPSVMK